MNTIFKFASILDPVQKILCPDVWTSDRKLYPHIKEHILQKLFNIVPQRNVVELYLIGSTTGYQWTETSDIDLNVTISPPELVTNPRLVLARKVQSGFLAQGTRHPVNFFWVAAMKDSQFWGDSAYGVYDVLNDIWVADPGVSDKTRDPQTEYKLPLISARLVLNQFDRLIELWLEDIRQLHKINLQPDSWEKDYFFNHKLAELREDSQRLIEFTHELDRDRKFAYNWSFGIPRKSHQNIVFKLMEGSQYETYFEFFKNLKAGDLVTNMKSIINKNNG